MYNNPILQSRERLNNQQPQMSPQMQQLRQMVQMYKNSQNSQQALQTMLEQNPELKQIQDIVTQAGGNGKQLFYALAKQKGIDPQVVLNQLGI